MTGLKKTTIVRNIFCFVLYYRGGLLTGGFAVEFSIFVYQAQCVLFTGVGGAHDATTSFAGTLLSTVFCQPCVSCLQTHTRQKTNVCCYSDVFLFVCFCAS